MTISEDAISQDSVAQTTLKYYNEHATDFYAATINADMTVHYSRFLKMLANKNSKIQEPTTKLHILDFGCGSGRDALFFLNQGFEVTAVDGCPELARSASILIKKPVICTDFRSYSPVPKSFDGIWACASLLHLAKAELEMVLKHLVKALATDGVMYMSFKYGSGTSMRNGRLFTDMNEEELASLLSQIPNACLLEEWITNDVRPERAADKWLNAILARKEATKT